MTSADASAPQLLLGRYESLRNEAFVHLQEGRAEEALTCLDTCKEVARKLDDPVHLDRVICNIAATEIELGRNHDSHLRYLRRALVENRDQEICRLAAYQIARIYDIKAQYKKALFYARIALEKALQIARLDWIAASRNQMGSLLLAESHFDEAHQELEEAHALLTSEDHLLRAVVLDNLGYCLVVGGETRRAFSCLFEGLRTVRRIKATLWEGELHLTLCYAYLEIDRWKRAAQHGLRALRHGEEFGNPDMVKKALFLLGETANLAGNEDSSYRYFSDLQERFYPDQVFLPDFLVAIDIRGLINLKA